MNTILIALLGYFLAKIQVSDPLVFKLGVGMLVVFAAFEAMAKFCVKVVFQLLTKGKK